MLIFQNTHVPISVSVCGTLERGPTHICERDLAELSYPQVCRRVGAAREADSNRDALSTCLAV